MSPPASSRAITNMRRRSRPRRRRSPGAPSWVIAGPTAGPRFGHLAALGLIAGAPAILGAWIGAAAFNPSVAALLFGVGLGAIVRVIVQLAPLMRDEDGRILNPTSVIGMLVGLSLLYATGLLVSV